MSCAEQNAGSGRLGWTVRAGSVRRAAVEALLISLALFAVAPAARADFRPIELQSVGPLEQFASAGEPAISGDGSYLAFEGTIGGVKGVYRKDLAGGEGQLQLVAGGSIYTREGATDASAPSISVDGRYVTFTSATQLLPAANPGSNVYVRDMDVPLPTSGVCDEEEEKQENGKRCAYELASALSGSDEGLTYGLGGSPTGAIASGRVAFGEGEHGREVAFVISSNSDLVSHNATQLTTPALQVAVRYLDTHETVLVSSELEPSIERLASGECAGSGSGPAGGCPVLGGAVTMSAQATTRGSVVLPGAALSGDGTTVAWLGAHIPAQAPTLSDERRRIENDDQNAGADEAYDEPLWRRIADGPAAPTRRMVGGGDPLAPGCPTGGSLEVRDCQGPYLDLSEEHWEERQHNYGWLGLTGVDNGTPQLSYDGWTAALIGDPSGESNVFVVDMHEGLDRDQALRRLTREIPVAGLTVPGLGLGYVSGAGEIQEAAVSPDGRRIAFTTQRQQFPLAPPNYTETPPVQLGVVELYQIDLARESVVRVTRGPGGAPSEEGAPATSVVFSGAASPSYTKDGFTLAFADTASNLVPGDANEASDVFTAINVEPPELPGPTQIAPAAVAQEPARAQWRLSVVPVVHADGSLTLYASVPGAGELSAHALAAVPVATSATHRSRRRPAARGTGRSARVSVLRNRVIAGARMPSTLPGLLELPLRVQAPYAKLLTTAAGIYATVDVKFAGPGGPTLSQTVTVSLRRSERTKIAAHGRGSRSHKRGGGASAKHAHRGGGA